MQIRYEGGWTPNSDRHFFSRRDKPVSPSAIWVGPRTYVNDLPGKRTGGIITMRKCMLNVIN